MCSIDLSIDALPGMLNPYSFEPEYPDHLNMLQKTALLGNLKLYDYIKEEFDYSDLSSRYYNYNPDPILIAIYKGDLEFTKYLYPGLEADADRMFWILGYALDVATEYEHYEICEFLVENLKDKHSKDYPFKRSPLMIAISKDNAQFCKLLSKYPGWENMEGEFGTTPFFEALNEKNLKSLKSYLKTLNPRIHKTEEEIHHYMLLLVMDSLKFAN